VARVIDRAGPPRFAERGGRDRGAPSRPRAPAFRLGRTL